MITLGAKIMVVSGGKERGCAQVEENSVVFCFLTWGWSPGVHLILIVTPYVNIL